MASPPGGAGSAPSTPYAPDATTPKIYTTTDRDITDLIKNIPSIAPTDQIKALRDYSYVLYNDVSAPDFITTTPREKLSCQLVMIDIDQRIQALQKDALDFENLDKEIKAHTKSTMSRVERIALKVLTRTFWSVLYGGVAGAAVGASVWYLAPTAPFMMIAGIIGGIAFLLVFSGPDKNDYFRLKDLEKSKAACRLSLEASIIALHSTLQIAQPKLKKMDEKQKAIPEANRDRKDFIYAHFHTGVNNAFNRLDPYVKPQAS